MFVAVMVPLSIWMVSGDEKGVNGVVLDMPFVSCYMAALRSRALGLGWEGWIYCSDEASQAGGLSEHVLAAKRICFSVFN